MAYTNIAVLVSGGGTNLQALLDAAASGQIKNGRIALVLSSKPGAYALERAKTAGIATAVADVKTFADRTAFADEILRIFEHYQIGLVVFAGFMYILPEHFCRRYQNAMINVHPALIPAFCGKGFFGLHVHEQVLAYGVKLTGATVHFVTEQADAGPVILQKAVEVLDDDTPETLQRRVMEQAEWQLLPHAVSLFCEGRLHVEGRRVKISEDE